MEAATDQAIRDRARGALLGLAVGDALGTTIEFSARDTRPHQADITGGGPFSLQAGQWTDDTSMALALAESLIARGRVEPLDIAERFLDWFHKGAYSCTGTCFDIGMATRSALARFEQTGDPIAGSTAESQAGNGSLMRLAPVALRDFRDPERLIADAALQSRITHGSPQAVEACVWFAELLARAILGEDKKALLLPDHRRAHPALKPVLEGAWAGKDRDGIRSSGYVVHTLEAALWSVARTGTFEDAVVLAVNLGDDADTVGAVTGQLAGAIYGRSAIPARWLKILAWEAEITRIADRLIDDGAAAA